MGRRREGRREKASEGLGFRSKGGAELLKWRAADCVLLAGACLQSLQVRMKGYSRKKRASVVGKVLGRTEELGLKASPDTSTVSCS